MSDLAVTAQIGGVATTTYAIRKGDDFSQLIRIKEDGLLLDMTGYSFEMQIRDYLNNYITIIELTDANSRIDISLADQGIIILNIAAADTNALKAEKAVFDLKWTDTEGKVKTILRGDVNIELTVTR